MNRLFDAGELGCIYHCRMFNANGTARLVRDSVWRDQGAGVLPYLGSHLLDTARFWFGELGDEFSILSSDCFENRSPDHVVIGSRHTEPRLELEMTLLSWRNHFTCDVFAENGSAHISSLCKWGPTTFTKRIRVLPSGRPAEETVTLAEDDRTWQLEYAHFRSLCQNGATADLSNDLWLNGLLRCLGQASRAPPARRDSADHAPGPARVAESARVSTCTALLPGPDACVRPRHRAGDEPRTVHCRLRGSPRGVARGIQGVLGRLRLPHS